MSIIQKIATLLLACSLYAGSATAEIADPVPSAQYSTTASDAPMRSPETEVKVVLNESSPPASSSNQAKPVESIAVPPGFVASSALNSGDTAWVLTSTALILLMTLPGLALFYGGMTRKKNVINTFMMVFCSACLVVICWVVGGYSLAFTEGNSFIGSIHRFFFTGMTFEKAAGYVSVHPLATNIPENLFALFQMTFAVITAGLITGAFVERVKFGSVLLFVILWHFLVYVPVAHWIWAPDGWFAMHGILDYAGGLVVHVNSGMAGLAFALVASNRDGFPAEPMPPSNLSLTMTGAALLWVGWFGFNAGSALAADGRAAQAFLATMLAAAVAAMSWMTTEWIVRGKPTILGVASGAVAGLVAVTPASGFVGPMGALILGLMAGPICWWAAAVLKRSMGVDDSLDVFGIHGMGGILGSLMTPFLNVQSISGLASNFTVQLVATVSVMVYSFIVTLLIVMLIAKLVGLRVSQKQEARGLDLSQHGETIEH